jgi:ubiquinone biosynthesis protein UbiJ
MTSYSPFSALLPDAINRLLSQESWARAKLAVHSGKVACLDAGLTTFRWQVGSDGLLEPAAAGQNPDVSIRIKPADLPLALQNRERLFSYVEVAGDADFANTISQVSQSLRWEVEEDLGKLVGDIPAARLVAGARTMLQAARSTGQKLAENTAEYFLEENPMLMRQLAVSDFGSDVIKLRDDVERLAKRIERLMGGVK